MSSILPTIQNTASAALTNAGKIIQSAGSATATKVNEFAAYIFPKIQEGASLAMKGIAFGTKTAIDYTNSHVIPAIKTGGTFLATKAWSGLMITKTFVLSHPHIMIPVGVCIATGALVFAFTRPANEHNVADSASTPKDVAVEAVDVAVEAVVISNT